MFLLKSILLITISFQATLVTKRQHSVIYRQHLLRGQLLKPCALLLSSILRIVDWNAMQQQLGHRLHQRQCQKISKIKLHLALRKMQSCLKVRVISKHMNLFLFKSFIPSTTCLLIIFPFYLCSRQITELDHETRKYNSFKVLVSIRDLRTTVEFHKTLSYAKPD